MRLRSLFFLRRHHLLLFIIALLFSALVLMSLRVKQRRGVDILDALWLEICSPLQSVATFTINAVQGVFHRYFFLVHVEEENALLKRRMGQLQQENYGMKEAALANERLRNLLDFREKVGSAMVGAEVIGRDPSSWFKSVTINRGDRDGVRKGMAVISPEGVIGQILKVSPRYSVVLLITDYNSAVDGIVQRTRGKAIVEGRGENRCQLKYLLRSEEVVPGDLIVTSGLVGNFPKGLTVGEIRKVEKEGHGIFQYVELVPSVDLTKLEEVFVITESFVMPSAEDREKEKEQAREQQKETEKKAKRPTGGRPKSR
jgi:rod shape-determining protein MreC